MKRSDIVTVAISGDYGRPRAALIVQSDSFERTASVTLLLITSRLIDAPLSRVTVNPTRDNGLRKPSQIMIDRLMTVPRTRVGQIVGHLDRETMRIVSRHIAAFLGIV